jgi:hypothetical protein
MSKKFTLSLCFKALNDKNFVLDTYLLDAILVVEINNVSKSGLRAEIRQPCTEVFEIFHQKL